MFPSSARIAGYDDELAQAIANEARRQEDHVELIASENYASPRVMEAQGSVLTNKYAEGYPGKRYYGGCEYVDVAEQLAIDRLKQLFGADYANVQPHSGSQANQAVYFALLNPGDTILGMSLAHGGHLTHGAKVNISGKLFNAVQYGVNEQGLIDYDEVERLARRAQAEDGRRRLQRLLAEDRLGALPRHRRQGRRVPVRRHGPRRRPGRRRRVPGPAAARARGHLDHAQDPARPARRHHRRQGRVRGPGQEAAEHRLPGHPGRSADARDRGQGRRLQGSAGAGVQRLPAAGRQERAGDGRRPSSRAATRSSPAAPRTT